MPPHHGAQNRCGGEAHLGLPWAPPHLFWVGTPSPGDISHAERYYRTLAVWTTSLVTSVTAWTPSRALTELHFSGCLDYKFDHINFLLFSGLWTTSLVTSVTAWTPSSAFTALYFICSVRTTSISALQWLFGLQVSSHQSLPGQCQGCLQHCSSGAV
ncbi:hypothetical protein TNIN_218291 [Trichonephila inaurata madagascariensis]|uniref:Uncharacterized protein n=1 Tax=Trichonephila inaurata madagascariensis TaxID=2747483 RepID=A0A8X6K0U3_9ARAC|nr:hypothetical protein TNIN_218291 [Trichonephila inaurata madagascariensis]